MCAYNAYIQKIFNIHHFKCIMSILYDLYGYIVFQRISLRISPLRPKFTKTKGGYNYSKPIKGDPFNKFHNLENKGGYRKGGMSLVISPDIQYFIEETKFQNYEKFQILQFKSCGKPKPKLGVFFMTSYEAQNWDPSTIFKTKVF